VTLDQVSDTIDKYESELKDGGRMPERFVGGFHEKGAFPTREAALRHLLWMCSQVKIFVGTRETEKAMRWIGFMQGVFWMAGVKSIDNMRDDNR
jgi:hypothetical protein